VLSEEHKLNNINKMRGDHIGSHFRRMAALVAVSQYSRVLEEAAFARRLFTELKPLEENCIDLAWLRKVDEAHWTKASPFADRD